MSNTVIQLKYSTVTTSPPSLNVGEAAYSFTSDKLFIGNTTNGVLTIGGKYYTDKVDAATNLSTPSTLVLRDSNGDFSANAITANLFIGDFDGNIDTATKLQTARDIGLAGDATGNVSFDGSANVTLTVDLSDTGVVAGTYGGASNVPYFTVDAEGRLTAAGNTSISTDLSVSADSGTGSLNLLTESLKIEGGDGITTLYTDPTATVVVNVDNTVVRTTGNQSITGDLSITGNLNIVGGNVVSVNVSTLVIDDPLLQLAANNESSDVVDIGFYGHYSDDGGTTKRHIGLFRDASAADQRFILFQNLVQSGLDDGSSVTVNTAAASFATANLQANLIGGKVSGLISAIAVGDGGTGATTFSSGQLLVGNGTNALQSLANTGTAGTYANASHVPVITTDAYGRVSSVVNTAIAISASQVTSGLLAVARGGTNNDTYTTGAMLQYDGTKIATLANTTYTLTGGLAASNTITSLTVDAYGRVTAATGAAIAIDTSQLTSGTLGVARGGTGNTTFTTNHVLLGAGTSAITTVGSSTEGHVLQINSSGVPTFAHLSGGTF